MLVGKYRNNTIKPMLYPDVIVQVAKKYNNAWILCEVNDIGDQVASIIFYDMEYENLLMTSMRVVLVRFWVTVSLVVRPSSV